MDNTEMPSWEEKENELNDKLITAQKVSEILNISKLSIINYAQKGLLKSLLVGEEIKPPNLQGGYKVKYAFPKKYIKGLKTWELLEAEIGSKLLKAEEAAAYFGVSARHLQTLLGEGFYSDLYFKVWEDFIPKGEKGFVKYAFPEKWLQEGNVKNRHLELFSGKGDALPDYFIAQSRGITLNELLDEIEKGIWSDAITEKKLTLRGRPIYYFSKEKMIECSSFHSLNVIADFLGFDRSLLRNYANKGLIVQPQFLEGTLLYDLRTLKEELPKIKESQYDVRHINVNKKVKPLDLLEEHQINLIEKFLEHREKGRQIVWEDKVYYKSKGLRKSSSTKETMRTKLATIIFKMIMNRCGLSVVLEGEIKGKFRSRNINDLNTEEIQILKENGSMKEFLSDLLISEDDFRAYEKGLSEYSVWNATCLIKPFLYWLLMEVEKKHNLWRVDIEVSKQYYALRQVLVGTINYLPSNEPLRKNENYKLFLNREQIIKVFQTLYNLNQLPSGSDEKGLKYATMWMCGHFLGLRPEEIHDLRIEYFLLDENGYLKTFNKKGYGILDLPAKASKQEVSPSHQDLKTLVVPQLVKLINVFLKYMYQYQSERGIGYLFRPLALKYSPDRKSESKNNHWVKEYKVYFDFLSPKDRENFIFKTSRHSLYNLFRKTGLNQQLENFKTRAGEIQMRHNISKKSGTTGEMYYMAEIGPGEYLKVVDEVLNYPWDLDELKRWEIEKGLNVNYENNNKKLGLFEFEEGSPSNDLDDKKDFMKAIKSHSKEILKEIVEERMVDVEDKDRTLELINSMEGELFKLRRLSAKKLGINPLERTKKIKELSDKLILLKQESS